MFPQVSMEAGCPYGYSHFITCNLSVRRDAVVEAGSFDSTYKLSEDTELGIRLQEMGYRVLYHPEAHALHDHLPYPARNLIRRARVYGADYFYMFGRHPRVMKEWAMPVNLTGMDEPNAIRLLHYVEAHRHEVEGAVQRWSAGTRLISKRCWQITPILPRRCSICSSRLCRRFTGSTCSRPCSRP